MQSVEKLRKSWSKLKEPGKTRRRLESATQNCQSAQLSMNNIARRPKVATKGVLGLATMTSLVIPGSKTPVVT